MGDSREEWRRERVKAIASEMAAEAVESRRQAAKNPEGSYSEAYRIGEASAYERFAYELQLVFEGE